MRQEMHAMKKDATEGGKIMYNALLSLKAAISYIADIILDDQSNKGMSEYRSITLDKIANPGENARDLGIGIV